MIEGATPSESSDETPESATRRVARRRASRAAGPSAAAVAEAPTAVGVDGSPAAKATAGRAAVGKPVGPPPRRQSHRTLVAAIALVTTAVLTATLAVTVVLMVHTRSEAVAKQAREQRFVDAGTQTVVNMFSYTQNTIDESVNRFIDGISGPLRDMMSQGNNVDNLKAIFRDTQANSEAVVSGAALEGDVDDIAGNAAVLVSVRVTVTDLDGVNAPSKPYRLRVIVHEDDDGHLTGYDLKYPDGGN